MCGRYLFSMEQPTLRELWEQARQRFPHVHMEAGEIFPTHTAPVLVGEGNALRAQPVRWGFPRVGGGGVVINARSETAGEKIMRCDSDSGKKLIKSMVLRTADRQGMC